ncbi:fungal-specific transcription factor domain-containing protein [Lineolata rhizophorae]|uniref:Fungal-specific transcription factor domain-containing protein n=1 Tax=Lineolata rhizophorae TaxID=578093 RepID=A0A6A6PCQ9_9PEZI|nr:fungal-specific transcription factor domain-containing protein [Lineolata rhizophorae]
MSNRPQVGIDRLPARRASNEPREAMNCKSCRKRKIKCNRMRPTCEACQVFACPCIYDAVPKKRGPKTDVLEALLKRVDGLEKRLHDEKKADGAETDPPTKDFNEPPGKDQAQPDRPTIEIPQKSSVSNSVLSPVEAGQPAQHLPSGLLDIYFARIHGKPHHILDEPTTRSRFQSGQLPNHLMFAVCAVASRYSPEFGGYNAAVRAGQDFARRSRMDLDVEEPTIENLQTLLLLAQAGYQAGKGKKAYMHLSSAISMALALDLHRELPAGLKVPPAEREARRRLFWACYLMDRFAACGSKRPSLVADESIMLRFPSWHVHPGSMVIEGDYFPNGSNVQYMAGPGKQSQGSTGMLIGICRILGITNRYLAAGGVKGDSHFPWHSLSNLSKIRQDLDIWASETHDTFISVDALFAQPDSAILALSKLVYHLIHCLIYRPFLPVDLTELSGTAQHQSWQIEATNLCFLHANAIAELVEIGRASSMVDWPEFVGYCICTAGTIHVHGAHYHGREGDVFAASADFLSREMNQLSELRFAWAGVEHQRETLQAVYGCHSELVKSLASNPMRFSPVFQLEDFFDRYPGRYFDGAHLTFADVVVDAVHESVTPYGVGQRNNLYIQPNVHMQGFYPVQQQLQPQFQAGASQQSAPPKKKRRPTNPSPTSNPAGMKPGLSQAQNGEPPPDPGSAVDLAPTISPFTPTFHFHAMAADLPPASNGQPPTGSMHDQSQSQNQPQQQQAGPSGAPNGGPAGGGPAAAAAAAAAAANGYDPMFSLPAAGPPYEAQTTPGATSATGSTHSHPSGSGGEDKDPFLSLLEQLAENEHSRGGPSELDFFLGGAG